MILCGSALFVRWTRSHGHLVFQPINVHNKMLYVVSELFTSELPVW
jgi:hypothetical protein